VGDHFLKVRGKRRAEKKEVMEPCRKDDQSQSHTQVLGSEEQGGNLQGNRRKVFSKGRVGKKGSEGKSFIIGCQGRTVGELRKWGKTGNR